jgi:hypothetical protein
MFGLLRAAFTLLICVLVIGFFLGWFSFTRAPVDPQSNKVNINVSVDRSKMGSDLQHLEQKVSKGIQDLNNPPPGGNPPAQQGTAPPRFSLGPMLTQPGGQQSGIPSLSLGPITLQPSTGAAAWPAAPSFSPPQPQPQTPDNQFTMPLGPPPPGEGR